MGQHREHLMNLAVATMKKAPTQMTQHRVRKTLDGVTILCRSRAKPMATKLAVATKTLLFLSTEEAATKTMVSTLCSRQSRKPRQHSRQPRRKLRRPEPHLKRLRQHSMYSKMLRQDRRKLTRMIKHRRQHKRRQSSRKKMTRQRKLRR